MRIHLLCCVLSVLVPPAVAATPGDGQHDFDFEIGTWKTHVKLLRQPLTGSKEWIELDGTSVVRSIANGRANLVELDVAGGALHIEGISLRLYNPAAKQWSLNYTNLKSGTLTAPVVGGFKDGRGAFFGSDSVDGRAVFVRFFITCANNDTCTFEQSFSDDGGKTWEANWIATDTRVKD
ncbi:MAG TPA: hypothetical protein VKB52_00510 [Rhodanobacteraceae bacterium]|nr:hypothetical protein [Rhodanobacteraceae bacterium]